MASIGTRCGRRAAQWASRAARRSAPWWIDPQNGAATSPRPATPAASPTLEAMSALNKVFWRLLPNLRSHERSRFLFFAALATLGSMAQTVGLVGSEALFLSRFGAEALPEAFIGASLLTVLGTFVYATWVGEVRNDRLFIQMLIGISVLLLGAAAAANNGVELVLPGLFCAWYLIQAVFVNHFLTFTGDYFDSLAAKRIFPLMAIAASAGGVLGGVVAAGLAPTLGPMSLIALWGALFVVCALILRLGHRPLRRWGPLELEEADETSVEGMQGALRYLRRSRLSRWLVLSALGMVMSLFIAQYLYSAIFIRTFPEPDTLAAFFGTYLAVTNGVEIALGFTLTPWLIQRFGVASANLIHPFLTFLSFGGLAFLPGLRAGVAARMNRELFENAVAFPVRSLIYNAMPARLRGRMRAFLEGIVVYAGMSVAGGVLLALGKPEPFWLCVAGGVASLVFFAANLKARREYVRELTERIRREGYDPEEIGDEIGRWGATRLAELWEQMLEEESGSRTSRTVLEMIPDLAARGITEPLIRATSYPSADVRRSCLNALAHVRGEEVDHAVDRALHDEDAGVRLAALRAAARRNPAVSLYDRVSGLAEDPDPRIRAEASLHLGASGIEILTRMIGSENAEEAAAALRLAPESLLDAVLGRIHDPAPALRAAALEGVARIAPDPPPGKDELLPALEDPDPRVRRAAVLLISSLEPHEAMPALAQALHDPSADVQFVAEAILGQLAEAAHEAVIPHLRADRERAAEGAMRVLSAGRTSNGRAILEAELRHRARELWYDLIAFQRLPDGDGIAARFLRTAFADALMRNRRMAFRALELIEEPSIIRRVGKALHRGSTRVRGDALEVLSNLGDRESARLLVMLHETGSLEEKMPRVLRSVPVPDTTEGLLEAARRSESRWIRMAAKAWDGADPTEEVTMERLLALKQVPLFANLSLEQLEAIHRITREVDYEAGEILMREGDPGGDLFLLIEGSVRVYKNHGTDDETFLSDMSVGSYIGEMATLDDEPRSATVVTAEPSRVLLLEGGSLKELILQMPEISFEIFRVLTGRVRAAESRLGGR